MPGACPAWLKVTTRVYQGVVLNELKVDGEDRALSVDFVDSDVNHGIDPLLLFLILNMYLLVRVSWLWKLLFSEAVRYCIY